MNIFKYSELKKFYQKIKRLGDTTLFKDFKGEKSFLIRHDVDFDLQLALDLALFENKLGIKSTYFISTTCESYNVLCEKNKKGLDLSGSLVHGCLPCPCRFLFPVFLNVMEPGVWVVDVTQGAPPSNICLWALPVSRGCNHGEWLALAVSTTFTQTWSAFHCNGWQQDSAEVV